jgi:hypothetical protein
MHAVHSFVACIDDVYRVASALQSTGKEIGDPLFIFNYQ